MMCEAAMFPMTTTPINIVQGDRVVIPSWIRGEVAGDAGDVGARWEGVA